MKKTILLVIAVVISLNCSAGNYYFAWYGLGFATHYNYSLTYGYGSYQYKGVSNGVGVGFMEINQKYDLFYNDEMGSNVGSNVRLTLNYYFLSPMAVFQLGKKGTTQCYVTGGAGYASGGSSTLHKWSHVPWSPAGESYDSTIDQSKAITSLVFRFGFGFAHFYHLGGNFHLFLNEDFGFVTTPMLKITDYDNTQLRTNTSQLFQPFFISLRFGLAFIPHSKNYPTPYKIRR